MKRPTKIALLVAAILLAWNAAGFSASVSEHRSLFFQTPVQSILPSAHSPQGEPLAYPDNRPTKPGILQIDSLSDVELGGLHMDISVTQSAPVPQYGYKTGFGAETGNIVLLLQRKKIIYPFHSFL